MSAFRSAINLSAFGDSIIGSAINNQLSKEWSFLTNVGDFTFTRAGDQFGIDSGGNLVKSTTDNAAFIFDEGILLEGARTNIVWDSFNPVTQTRTVTAVTHTIKIKGTGSVTLTGVGAGVVTEASPLTLTPTAGGLIMTVAGSVTHAQLEIGEFSSSFIETPVGTTGSRSDTLLNRAWPFPLNGISGQIKVRPQFDATDDKGFTGIMVFQNNASPGTDNLELFYHGTLDRIFLGKDVANVHAETSTASGELNYVKGDLLNIRFKADSLGLHLWVNSVPKKFIGTGVAPTDWAAVLDEICIGVRQANTAHSFQAVEFEHIWNFAQPDSFLEARI